jgi:hypothetical protein
MIDPQRSYFNYDCRTPDPEVKENFFSNKMLTSLGQKQKSTDFPKESFG